MPTCGRCRRRRRGWSWAAWLFAFACFFPYPALAIGGHTGLQVSQAAALAAIPFLVARPPGRSFRAILLLLGPEFVSMFLNHTFADVPSPDVLVNTSIGLALAVLVIWPADWLADRDLFREVLAAAGAAIVLHSLIGLLQLDSFSKDQFPLLFLYVNPSFMSMQEWAEVYARQIKRPCGLFPEPSAMAASLGPWIVLLAGLLLDPGLRRRLGWRRAWPVIPPVASGCLLLALSVSGSTFALMTALLVICAGGVWRMVHAPPRPSQLVMVALVLLSVASVLGYAIPQLGSGNLEGRIDSSWGLARPGSAWASHSTPIRSTSPSGLAPARHTRSSGATGRAHHSPTKSRASLGSGAWPSPTTRRRDCWALRRCWPC